MTEAQRIGLRIKQARRVKGWTMDDLADEIGVHRFAVWHWEHGKNRPAPRYRRNLAQALGVAWAWLEPPPLHDCCPTCGRARDGIGRQLVDTPAVYRVEVNG